MYLVCSLGEQGLCAGLMKSLRPAQVSVQQEMDQFESLELAMTGQNHTGN